MGVKGSIPAKNVFSSGFDPLFWFSVVIKSDGYFGFGIQPRNTWALNNQRWYKVNAKQSADLFPSGERGTSWTNDSGRFTSRPDEILQRSLSNWTCLPSRGKFFSIVPKLKWKYEATFNDKIFRASCFLPTFVDNFSILLSESESGELMSLLVCWLFSDGEQIPERD